MKDGHNPRNSPLLLGFPEYEAPAQRLATALGTDYAPVEVHHFPDGESRVRLPPSLPAEVILCRSLNDPNGRLVELLLAAATARELGARRLSLVAPYLCYMRQDTAFHPGEAVSQRIVGRWLAEHLDRLATVDPHLHRTAQLADAVPVAEAITLSAAPLIGAFIKHRLGSPLLLGPDEESAQWVASAARPHGLDYGVARKQRHGDLEVEIELPPLAVAGREVVLVDDVASSGHTLAVAAKRLHEAGAATVHAVVTHALFAGDALEVMREAGITSVWSTDSIPHSSNAIELAPLLASGLQAIY
ncbi:ribose-phosphate diphosphokinase [Thiohalobacter sp. IOR34]|uniref:ribose-phosphate diphosphokinase n=1 Tax=Thiohalobacter sp. IOR34 TaxID=3057176 RepID=UPI0025B2022D|nr:ribose-phosphate diphosphokinase [Thiohalobacter sp. IOR34]WJW74973.1 ribose-phosphate diphosphokinase [Thiohalobacter sp. IOR34]